MKIALIGYGKMGKAIEEILLQKHDEVVLRIALENKHELTPDSVRQADVAIEFTGPESALENVLFCLNHDVPVVCGSTGWLEELGQVEKVVSERKGSFLYASNFSVGVNIFFELNRKLATLMAGRDEYNVEITETHHIHKLDAPSGTAITLAEGIIDAGLRSNYSLDGVDADTLQITSLREDEVPGTHLVGYFSDDDQIEIVHTAHNRKGFAAGAVAAAKFLKDRKGIYSMRDVLGI